MKLTNQERQDLDTITKAIVFVNEWNKFMLSYNGPLIEFKSKSFKSSFILNSKGEVLWNTNVGWDKDTTKRLSDMILFIKTLE